MSVEEAKKNIYMMDSKGLVTTTRGDELAAHKKLFARSHGSTGFYKVASCLVF